MPRPSKPKSSFLYKDHLPIPASKFYQQLSDKGNFSCLIPTLSGIAEFIMRVGVAMLVGIVGLPESWIFAAEFSAWTGATVLLCISYYICARKLGKE